jgi:hypothetical protein
MIKASLQAPGPLFSNRSPEHLALCYTLPPPPPQPAPSPGVSSRLVLPSSRKPDFVDVELSGLHRDGLMVGLM